jgi:hypothetical protein
VGTRQSDVREGSAGLTARDRELTVQEFLEEAETLRRILQAQTATLLLLTIGSGGNTESLLNNLENVGKWVAELDASLRERAHTNSTAARLLNLTAQVRASQVELVAIASPLMNQKDFQNSILGGQRRLVTINARMEAMFDGTSAEMRSFASGCACESDRLAGMREK